MSECHIRGLGACMIGGYPHRPEDSFLHLAIERLRLHTTKRIVSSLSTLDGFPITRVPKHIDARCLAAKPDIVVIQFATSDHIVPLRRKRNRRNGSVSPVQRIVSNTAPTLTSHLKWQLHGLVADILRLSPVTPTEIYLETMRQIVEKFLEHQVVPVVMSPFIFGDRRSDRFARNCTARLQQSMSTQPGAVLVDAYSALSRHPRSRMLLADGTHLSLAGHEQVAEALVPHLQSLVENPGQPRLLPGSALLIKAQPMRCEITARANSVPLPLVSPFTSHWLLPYQGSAAVGLPFHLALAVPPAVAR